MSKTKGKTLFDPGKFDYGNRWSAIAEPYEITTPLLGRPKLNTFFRTHPGKAYVANVGVIEAEGPYLVDSKLYKHFGRDVRVQRLFTTVDCEGTIRLWLVHVPDYDYYGRGLIIWNQTALEAVERAKNEWVQIDWNPVTGTYHVQRAPSDLGDPGFERIPPFSKIFNSAFKDRLITDLDHHVVRRLKALSEKDYEKYCERSGP